MCRSMWKCADLVLQDADSLFARDSACLCTQHAKGKVVISYNLFDLNDLDFREWFGSDNSPQKKLKRILGHSNCKMCFVKCVVHVESE